MRRFASDTFRFFIVVVVALLAVPALAQFDLDIEISQIIERTPLGTSKIALSVVDATTGNPLVIHDDVTPMIPASNMKLLTSGAALIVLGTDFVYETRLVCGDDDTLYIIGSGDPALADPALLLEMEMGFDELVGMWVEDIATCDKAQSIRRLIVDDRIFENEGFHPTWDEHDRLRTYAAPVSGFNFHTNIITFFVNPNKSVGLAPEFTIEPGVSSVVSVLNKATTHQKGGAPSASGIWVSRSLDANVFSLHGQISSPQRAEVPVVQPAELFADLLAERLGDAGMTITTSRAARDDDVRLSITTPDQAVGHSIRTPISTVLKRCNTHSNNLYAESLFKRIGHGVTGQPGSWGNGQAIMRLILSKHLGPDLAVGVTIADGSGLSRENRVTSHLVTAWLSMMYQTEHLRDVYVDSMAEPGEPGTLRKRFAKDALTNRVVAKSGYMKGISCLSGYVISPDGQAIAFSILVNNIGGTTGRGEFATVGKVKRVQERIVKAIDMYLAESSRVVRQDGGVVSGP